MAVDGGGRPGAPQEPAPGPAAPAAAPLRAGEGAGEGEGGSGQRARAGGDLNPGRGPPSRAPPRHRLPRSHTRTLRCQGPGRRAGSPPGAWGGLGAGGGGRGWGAGAASRASRPSPPGSGQRESRERRPTGRPRPGLRPSSGPPTAPAPAPPPHPARRLDARTPFRADGRAHPRARAPGAPRASGGGARARAHTPQAHTDPDGGPAPQAGTQSHSGRPAGGHTQHLCVPSFRSHAERGPPLAPGTQGGRDTCTGPRKAGPGRGWTGGGAPLPVSGHRARPRRAPRRPCLALGFPVHFAARCHSGDPLESECQGGRARRLLGTGPQPGACTAPP